MFLYWFTAILTLGSAMARDTLKSARPTPIISNSLVNLGKMDISFHFGATDIPQSRIKPSAYSSSLFIQPEHTVDGPCPCSGIKKFKEPLMGNPSDIIDQIIRSNDLFSYYKDPVTSSMCCESHERVHEDIVTFEFNPKQINRNAHRNSFFPFPLIFDKFMPQKPYLPPSTYVKPKAIDLILFPKNKDLTAEIGKFQAKKDLIQIVGDKELKNNFSNFKLRPYVRPNTSTVKKDLTNQDSNRLQDKEEAKVTTTVSAIHSNIL